MSETPLVIDSIWRDPKTNRRLRIVSVEARRVGVRNCQTGRLSHLPLWQFQHWLICGS